MQTSWIFPSQGLPVEQIIPELQQSLTHHGLGILRAEPGAGKTTVVPLALLDSPWMGQGGRILMLQPRRVAARAAAQRMAFFLGEVVGETVGYRVSMESRVSEKTQIEVLTEGILTRMIQSEPDLPGVKLIIFDEFHERGLQADLGLALALEVRESLRADLRILVMSATLDKDALSRVLDPSGTLVAIDCPGRLFPVKLVWKPPQRKSGSGQSDFWTQPQEFLRHVASCTREGIEKTKGDVLVFLPGMREIARVAGELAGVDAEICQLHGSMPVGDQNAVLQPRDRRRIILATSVAETSLTIPGVTLVVDSGLSRYNRFDVRLGMDRLVTERVSAAAAIQRQGRAGRTQSGECWNLWPVDEKLAPWLPPESERADLSSFVLEAAAWGCSAPRDLRLLSKPSETLWKLAQELLRSLDALSDGDFAITQKGRAMAKLGLAPRAACMVLHARESSLETLGYACASLLGERDIFLDAVSADFGLRLDILLGQSSKRSGGAGSPLLNHAQCERSRALFQKWLSQDAAHRTGDIDTDQAGILVACAWPDRVGHLKEVVKLHSGRLEAQYVLSTGRVASLSGEDAHQAPPWIVVIEAEAGEATTRIRMFVRIGDEIGGLNAIQSLFSRQILESVEITWDGFRPRARAVKKLDRLVLEEKPAHINTTDRELLARECCGMIRSGGIQSLPWTDESLATRTRLRWASAHSSELPDPSDQVLLETLEVWLCPYFRHGPGLLVDESIVCNAMENFLPWDKKAWVDSEVPVSLVVPSGTRKKIEYQPDGMPILAVRIQEIFGMAVQPRILGVPLVLHLLSPAQRPLQITSDLEGFWRNTWPEIRKEMRGRYPRHYWPDNPLEAEPTSRSKPRPK